MQRQFALRTVFVIVTGLCLNLALLSNESTAGYFIFALPVSLFLGTFAPICWSQSKYVGDAAALATVVSVGITAAVYSVYGFLTATGLGRIALAIVGAMLGVGIGFTVSLLLALLISA